jgi:hypothetical protein
MRCLIVRQPYASLIAFGCKKWEFRSYNSCKAGKIAIAASRGPPLKTGSLELNKAAKHFPRGVALATGEIIRSFFVTNQDLKEKYTGATKVKIHDQEFIVAKSPLGEPIEDIELAIGDSEWKSYVWELNNVIPLIKPIDLCKRTNSTWSSIELKELEQAAKKQLITSYF